MDTSNIFKLLSSFYNVFNGANKKEQENKESAIQENQTDVAKSEEKLSPLNYGMLKTMRSHDEFVRRVTNKTMQNKIPQK